MGCPKICQIFFVALIATSNPEEKKEPVSSKYLSHLENRCDISIAHKDLFLTQNV
jgi:hypothetical protein